MDLYIHSIDSIVALCLWRGSVMRAPRALFKFRRRRRRRMWAVVSSPERMMRVHDLKVILSIFFFFLQHFVSGRIWGGAAFCPPRSTFGHVLGYWQDCLHFFLGQRCLMFANDVLLLLFVLSASVLLFMAFVIRHKKKDSNKKLLY